MGLEEKPEHPRSDLALAGVHLFTPAVHEPVPAVQPSSWRDQEEGAHVEVTPAAGVPSAHRTVLGDHTKVQIRS